MTGTGELPFGSPQPGSPKRGAAERGAAERDAARSAQEREEAQPRQTQGGQTQPEQAQPEQAQPAAAARDAQAPILSVRELSARIQGRLKGLGPLAVQGEVSSWRRPASGHVYFDLKDSTAGAEALVHCAIWRSQVREALGALGREPAEGDEVVVHGKLDVYAPRGSYSLLVERLEQRGLGVLLAQLEELKRELAARGWFERRRPLPRFPRTIGLVTSRDGAALRDFLRTRSLRWPGYPVRLAHAPVQGAGASAALAEALRRLDASGVDLIVLCRGGGSVEDLWAFNELALAEAIWGSSVPVVSGVGHESDTTLADLVADRRAHTPTDAAQLAIPDRAELLERMGRLQGYLLEALEGQLDRRRERLERVAAARVVREPARVFERRAERLRVAGERLGLAARAALERRGRRLETGSARLVAQGPRVRLERQAERLGVLRERLGRPLAELLGERARRLELAGRTLEATSPFRVLERGYSITLRAGSGRPILAAQDLAPGERILTLLSRGALEARVESVRPRREGEGLADAAGTLEPSDGA